MAISLFEYLWSLTRCIQTGSEYYVSISPLCLILKCFPHYDEETSQEMRGTELPNKTRIPAITRYILKNPTNYTFSAITAPINADIIFEAMETEVDARKIGCLRVPRETWFDIHQEEHRWVAIEMPLKENSALGYETINYG